MIAYGSMKLDRLPEPSGMACILVSRSRQGSDLCRATTKPCPYCLEQQFDKQSHWKRWQVITSCCFLEVLACDHGSSAHRGDCHAVPALGDSSGAPIQLGQSSGACHVLRPDLGTPPGRNKRPRRGARTERGPGCSWDQPSPRMASSARHHPQSRGGRNPQERARASPNNPCWIPTAAGREEDPRESGDGLLHQAARLALHQESQLQMIAQDVRLHFYFRRAPPTSVLRWSSKLRLAGET